MLGLGKRGQTVLGLRACQGLGLNVWLMQQGLWYQGYCGVYWGFAAWSPDFQHGLEAVYLWVLSEPAQVDNCVPVVLSLETFVLNLPSESCRASLWLMFLCTDFTTFILEMI